MTNGDHLYLSLGALMPAIQETLAAGESATIRIKGVSMEPFLINGRDAVELVALGERPIRVGDLLLFAREDRSFALHRVCRVYPDDTFDIVGDNQQVRDLCVPREAVIAYVPRAWRNGKKINCEAGIWRTMMILYMRVRLWHPHAAYWCVRMVRRFLRVCRNPSVILRRIKHSGEKHEQ